MCIIEVQYKAYFVTSVILLYMSSFCWIILFEVRSRVKFASFWLFKIGFNSVFWKRRCGNYFLLYKFGAVHAAWIWLLSEAPEGIHGLSNRMKNISVLMSFPGYYLNEMKYMLDCCNHGLHCHVFSFRHTAVSHFNAVQRLFVVIFLCLHVSCLKSLEIRTCQNLSYLFHLVDFFQKYTLLKKPHWLCASSL